MKISKWTLSKQLWFLAGLFMVNLVVVGVMEFRNGHVLVGQLALIAEKQLPAIRNMTLADMVHEGIQAAVYRAIYAGDHGDLTAVQEIKKEFKEISDDGLKHLKELSDLKLNEAQTQAVQDVIPKFNNYVNAGNSIIESYLKGEKSKIKEELSHFDTQFAAMELEFGKLGDFIHNESENIKKGAFAQAEQSENLNIIITLISLVVGFCLAWYLIHNMVQNFKKIILHLSEEVNRLSSTSSQVSSTSQTLAEAATEQSASIEETVSSMEEITSMLDQTSHHSSRSLQIAEDSQNVAAEGRQTISRLGHAMDEIQTANTKLERIVGLIEDIRQKTKVINDIVFETRLLSFNASIEAARAGIHGKGFAVVAEEVGKLASLSGKSAEEIRSLLDSSTKEVADVVKATSDRVQTGKTASYDCEQAFTAMRDTLLKISESVKTIAHATKEQHVGIKQTNQAMQEMETVTQSNAQTAEVLSAHSSDLDSAARTMKKDIGLLKRFVVDDDIDFVSSESLDANPAKKNKSSSKVSKFQKRDTTVRKQSALELEVSAPAEANGGSDVARPEEADRGDSRWKSA
jgi:methyl-accepting chemotaxis protein